MPLFSKGHIKQNLAEQNQARFQSIYKTNFTMFNNGIKHMFQGMDKKDLTPLGIAFRICLLTIGSCLGLSFSFLLIAQAINLI